MQPDGNPGWGGAAMFSMTVLYFALKGFLLFALVKALV